MLNRFLHSRYADNGKTLRIKGDGLRADGPIHQGFSGVKMFGPLNNADSLHFPADAFIGDDNIDGRTLLLEFCTAKRERHPNNGLA